MLSKCIRCMSALAVVLLILAWASASAGDSKVTKAMTFKIAKGGTLVVEIEGIGADIAVHAWDKSEVEMRIDGLSEEALKDLETSESANTLRIQYVGDRGWGKSRSARFELSVPVEINLDLGTSGGDIEAGNVKGELQASTAGGDITIGSVEKGLTASTAGGDVTIEDVGGDARVSTAGGDIIVGKVSGSASLKTAGGDIELLGATGTVEVKTAGGDIECNKVTGSLDAATAGGDIYAELNPTGERANRLETQGGDIRIVIPSDANVTIDARIRIRHGWGGKDEEYDITSDFPAASHQKDKKLVQGRYVVGSGGATITLETVNGNIEIRKEPRTQ